MANKGPPTINSTRTTPTTTHYRSEFPHDGTTNRQYVDLNDVNYNIADNNESSFFPLRALIPIIVLMSAVIGIAIAVNSLVIASYVTDARLRTVSNLYLFHLALCDLVIGLISIPVYLASVATHEIWPFGRAFCKVYMMADFTVCAQSVFLVILISVDQLLILRKGVRYTSTETKGKAYTKITIAWVVAFLLYSPAILFSDMVVDFSGLGQPDCDIDFYVSGSYIVGAVQIEFVFPTVALTVLNVWVYKEIKKLTKVNVPSAVSSATSRAVAVDSNVVGTADTGTRQSLQSNNFRTTVSTIECLSKPFRPSSTFTTSRSKITVSGSKKTKCFPNWSRKKTMINPDERSSDLSQNNSNISTVHLRRTGPGDDTNNNENTQPPSTEVHSLYREELLNHDTKPRFEKANGACELSFVAMKEIKKEKTRQEQCSVTDTCVESSDAELPGETNPEPTAHPGCQKTCVTYISSTPDQRSAIINECRGSVVSSNKNNNAPKTSQRRGSNQSNASKTSQRWASNQSNAPETSQRRISNQSVSLKICQKRTWNQPAVSASATGRFTMFKMSRKNLKAARALFIFVFVFIMMWAPYSISEIVVAFCKRQCTNEYAKESFDWLLWGKSAVNPFLYAARNVRFKVNFYRILGRICLCCKDRLILLSTQARKSVVW